MVRRRKLRSRSPRYPHRWPWVVTWIGILTLTLGALAGLAFLVGHGEPVRTGSSFVDAVLAATRNTGPAVAVAFAVLTVAAWCFRHLWLDWLA
jgi:hypothetical protein